MHRAEHWQAMNQTDRAVLDVIRQYSVKFGAAHLKHDTIAGRIGKSNVTVRRAIRELAQLNIIEKIHYVRPVMNGLGANIYSIKPFEEPEKLVEPAKPEVVEVVEEEFAPITYFGRIKAFLASTIGESKAARNFFGVYRQSTMPILKFSVHADKRNCFEELGIRTLYIAVQATKSRKINNLPGYFSGVLRKLMDEFLFNDLCMDYGELPEENE